MTAKKARTGGRLAVLGAGNLGQALARGWVESGRFAPEEITLTRREVNRLEELARRGFDVRSDNAAAVASAETIVVAVQPQQIAGVLREIRDALDPSKHRLISVVTGVSIETIADLVGAEVPIVRAMPNTAVSIGESMTCLATRDPNQHAVQETQALFNLVGATLSIQEELMVSATALCACGVAFFLRSIRAASQGGIEIGFHPEEALFLAAQTAKGAAAMLLREGRHPEAEIDRVTTPRGCTIAGLNEMEHQGLSSALIKGILVSATNARALFDIDQG